MKSPDRDEVIPASTYPLTRHKFDASRSFAYSSLGALGSALPLPWVPDLVVRKIRGTLLHDIASRHGVALMDEARDVLVESWFPGVPKLSGLTAAAVSQAGRFAAGRALAFLGPLAWLPPVRSALYTFVLGHVFDRYMETTRISRAVRIDADEARAIKKAIERAMLTMATVKSESPWKDPVNAPEELRGDATRLVDGIVLSMVSLPGWFVSRLDSAFDDAWTSARES